MKIGAFLLSAFGLPVMAFAGEAGLTRTFQPINGVNFSSGISIEGILCYDWNASSGLPTAIYLISAPNKPPTNSPAHVEDINLASIHGITFKGGDVDAGTPDPVVLDATGYKTALSDTFSREDILKACLECLRRVLPEKLAKAPITFTAQAKDREWIGKIVNEFNAHDRTKPFFVPES